jgi:glycosyltransferase involved in cell wall biosynthesis
MKRVLFFTQNRWAFGTIHHALCKELYQHGIYANLLDWTQYYTPEELALLDRTYDIIVTNPEAVELYLVKWGFDRRKIVVIAHAQWDLLKAQAEGGTEFLSEVRNFAVISDVLVQKARDMGIERKPKITPLGIHTDMFHAPIAPALRTVGYAGQVVSANFAGVDIKRGHLVETAVSGVAGLALRTHGNYNHLCMPGYYHTIDGLVVSSSEEAGGLPAMEAAAAGRLVIGTPVGYFEHTGDQGGGITVPIEPEAFVAKTQEHLTYYRDNPSQYRLQCESIQQYARDNYDWSRVIDAWLEVME